MGFEQANFHDVIDVDVSHGVVVVDASHGVVVVDDAAAVVDVVVVVHVLETYEKLGSFAHESGF